MRFSQGMLVGSILVLVGVLPVSAESPPPPEPADTWECPMGEGGSIYTNKKRAGCREVLLKPLSIVPSLEGMATTPGSMGAGSQHDNVTVHHDRVLGVGGQNVPDWARDWDAGIASRGPAQEEVCALYSEWLHLAQKTRGGFFFGSDPSYGGEPSGRHQRGASYSFYDNARWIGLSRLFGTGFVPVSCP